MNIEELKERKRALGYSNEKIAEISGVPLSTVQKIFAGVTQQPRYDTLAALDLIIEVLSPSTRRKDMTIKLHKYEEAGVREYWLVDVDARKIVAYGLDGDMILQVYTFEDRVPVAIFDGQCVIDMPQIMEELAFFFSLDR